MRFKKGDRVMLNDEFRKGNPLARLKFRRGVVQNIGTRANSILVVWDGRRYPEALAERYLDYEDVRV
jgi:hypothetical protein